MVGVMMQTVKRLTMKITSSEAVFFSFTVILLSYTNATDAREYKFIAITAFQVFVFIDFSVSGAVSGSTSAPNSFSYISLS